MTEGNNGMLPPILGFVVVKESLNVTAEKKHIQGNLKLPYREKDNFSVLHK